ncbi:MAG: carboxypeptidase regulatory-like domain-containing protein [Candidatus Riflebacteria bacterium]|nr:carboxypeptidase regulatory-like domain-containing protein [Candidatus Riflebacteria bacterium]
MVRRTHLSLFFHPMIAVCTFVVVSFFVISMIGCGGVNPSDGSTSPSNGPVDLTAGGISGTVIGSDTGLLSGAVVESGGKQSTTATDGRFLLQPLSAGDYRVTARASRYVPTVIEGVRVLPGRITDGVRIDMLTQSATASTDFSVTALNPAFGTDGDTIGILGMGLGRIPGRITVAGKDASIMDWNSKNDGLVLIRLPVEVETGPVHATINARESAEIPPVIFTARPIALEAIPPIAKPGMLISITGRNFHEVGAFNKVTLNGRPCLVRAATSRRLDVELPPGAETGLLQVRIESDLYQLDGISTARVTLPPTLIHLSPKRSLTDVPLTLYGTNFGSDRSAISIILNDGRTLGSTYISAFTPTQLTFTQPEGGLASPGKSVQLRVAVSGSPSDQTMTYTAYDQTLTTLASYGFYDFTNVSNAQTLHLAKLAANDRIAFVSVFAGDGTNDLAGSFSYALTAILGGNTTAVPQLPGSSLRGNTTWHASSASGKRYRDVGLELRLAERSRAGSRQSISAGSRREASLSAVSEPAAATISVWLENLSTTPVGSSAQDVLATGTLVASGVHTLVYLDIASDTSLTATEAMRAAAWFDSIYATLATACWDGFSTPPEGNIDVQPRVVLFLSPQLNRGNTGSLVVLGYFNPRDKSATAVHSAGTEIIYAWDQQLRINSSDFQGVLAHELQHMMYYNQKGNQGTVWLDEGLAVFAQQLVGFGFPQGQPTPVSQVAAYLQVPHTVSLNHWPTDAGLENYGLSYLFIQYLFERCGGFKAISKLERNNGSMGFSDVLNNVIKSSDTTVSTADLQSFFTEWGLALYCDELFATATTTLSGYRPDVFSYRDIQLRKKFANVMGLRHITMNENPALILNLPIQGYGFDVVEYLGGNGGDLEVSIPAVPVNDGKTFKTWVLYYPASN